MSDHATVRPGIDDSVPIMFRLRQELPFLIAPSDGSHVDAFQRWRVSNPVTLFESSMEIDKQPLLWVESNSGTGGNSYNSNQSSVTLTTGGASSTAVRQSRQYIRYQPGKSMLLMFSGTLGTRAVNTTRRIGLFDVSNGIFLEQTDSDIAWVIRTNTSGSPVNAARVVQSAWNVDTLDGTGASGLILDESEAIIGIIDLEWLGVGRVRVGFVIDGQIYYVQTFTNFGGPIVYMQRASLPVRYEISTGASGGNQSLLQICSTVISEGGYIPRGMIRAGGNGTTFVTVTSPTRLPIVALRLKSAYNRALMYPLSLQVANNSNAMCHFDMRVRATVTGGAWLAVSEAVEINTTGTTVSGGYVIAETFAEKDAAIASLNLAESQLDNASDYAGIADVLVVTALPLSGAVSVAASVQWREIF